jgi:leucyl-tRNA synthetase
MFVKILSPFAPHVAEELWQRLGHRSTITYQAWPVHDESKLVLATIEIAVQVNGKVRSTISVAADATEEAVLDLAKADAKVAPFIAGKPLKVAKYIKGRLVTLAV